MYKSHALGARALSSLTLQGGKNRWPDKGTEKFVPKRVHCSPAHHLPIIECSTFERGGDYQVHCASAR